MGTGAVSGNVLGMLDKLMVHCDAHGDYEAGIGYGRQAQRNDPVRECTHQQLMYLFYLNGEWNLLGLPADQICAQRTQMPHLLAADLPGVPANIVYLAIVRSTSHSQGRL